MKVKYIDANRMTNIIYRIFNDILTVVGNVAVTKYMIPTGLSKRSGLKGVGVKVNDTKLTWRSGRLARSLSQGVQKNTDAIRKVTKTKNAIIGEIGTKVPYARFHELGIGQKRRPFLHPAIEDISTIRSIKNLIVNAINEFKE